MLHKLSLGLVHQVQYSQCSGYIIQVRPLVGGQLQSDVVPFDHEDIIWPGLRQLPDLIYILFSCTEHYHFSRAVFRKWRNGIVRMPRAAVGRTVILQRSIQRFPAENSAELIDGILGAVRIVVVAVPTPSEPPGEHRPTGKHPFLDCSQFILR